MKYRSVFDIIGPVMIGPSSSHTAGAARIGLLARKLFGREPKKVTIHFYGSFAQTYKGHATDVAVVSGVLGYASDDERIPNALQIAQAGGLDLHFVVEEAVPKHPNTVMIELQSDEDRIQVIGISIGGGLVQITQVDDFQLRLSGESPALLIFHQDAYGAIASVTQLLAYEQVNINHMEVSRSDRGKTALMVIETDTPVSPDIVKLITRQPLIRKVIILDI